MTGSADVLRVLEAIGAPHALIGAHAMAARGYPRFTVDTDFLTTDPRVLDRTTWATLEAAGAVVDARRGDQDDPLAGVVHIELPGGADVDVVLAKWKWEASVIARAEPMRVAGLEVPVVQLADLILLKLAAGGHLDLHDAAVLLTLADREPLVHAIEGRLPEVRPDVTGAWRDLLAADRATPPRPD
jgi:hypothetical protein